jgi:hypothetical protein
VERPHAERCAPRPCTIAVEFCWPASPNVIPNAITGNSGALCPANDAPTQSRNNYVPYTRSTIVRGKNSVRQ